MVYASYAKIVYTEKFQSKQLKRGWLIAEADHELASYISKLLWSITCPTNYKFPMRGPHITVVAGEKEENKFSFDELVKYNNNIIKFTWNWPLYTNGRAYWLNIMSDDLAEIRRDLGLVERKLHLTIGNTK